jgi:5-formyltetrahydrofolate cyclo-ligase
MGGNDTKRLLRDALRSSRRRLAADWLARRSADVCARILASDAFAAARRLVGYAPMPGEVDPGSVLDAAHARGVPVYLPRLEGDALRFLAPDGPLVPGRHGVLEPASGTPLGGTDPATMFLVPGVAFDLTGTRLGRGGGHYDRALPACPGATTVGVAFEFQIIPRLPRDAWDVSVWAVATDARLIVTTPQDAGRP